MSWAVPLAMILITVAVFAIAAVCMEHPARPKRDWGQLIGSLPTAPWDGETYEHPGYAYPFYAHGRHRRMLR